MHGLSWGRGRGRSPGRGRLGGGRRGDRGRRRWLGALAAISVAACAALACFSTGCGFTGETPFTGRLTPDATPFVDRGAITFCDGDVRIGIAKSRPMGLCLDAAPAPKACATDGECQSRERCTCAGCQVAACDSPGECGPDRVCTFADHRCDRACAIDADCAAGERCPPGLGACRKSCGSDGECQSGEVCESGLCAVSLGATGLPCQRDADCQDHPHCVLQRVPGDLREPSPLVTDGGDIVLYLERRGTPSTVWRAVSPKSLGPERGLRFRFSPAAPVLVPDASDLDRAGAPSVIAYGGGFLAVYASGGNVLRSAHSSDGIAFALDAAPVASATISWQAGGLDGPSLAAAPTVGGGAGNLFLYYAALDRSALGLLDSSDGRVWHAHPDPVLSPARVADPVLFRDANALASPFAMRAIAPDKSAVIRLYFAARGRESQDAMMFGMPVAEALNFSILEASSLDGTTLVPWPFNPVFDRVRQLLDHLSELDPAVLDLDDEPARRLLFYRGASADESQPGPLSLAGMVTVLTN